MRYLGVDVAKNTLEVADASGRRRRSCPNTGAGIKALLHWLVQDFCPGELHLVLEPTSTYHHPLVVALTAQAMRGDEAQARAAGCDAYLTKPVDTRAFWNILRQFLPRDDVPSR